METFEVSQWQISVRGKTRHQHRELLSALLRVFGFTFKRKLKTLTDKHTQTNSNTSPNIFYKSQYPKLTQSSYMTMTLENV